MIFMTTKKEIQPLLPGDLSLQIGLNANRAAAQTRFKEYRSRRAEETLRRQDADLALFHEFLELVNLRQLLSLTLVDQLMDFSFQRFCSSFRSRATVL